MKKYVIFTTFTGIKGTTEENYSAFYQNARLIQDFRGFENVEDVKNYVVQYLGYSPKNVIVID